MQAGSVLGAKADLVVRMADGAADIDAAQHLRYRVFYEELVGQARCGGAADAARQRCTSTRSATISWW